MGLFDRSKSRSSSDGSGEAILQLLQELSSNPGVAIAKVLSAHDQPVAIVAHALLLMLEAGALKTEDVGLLGIDARELERLSHALQSSENVQQFQYHLSVAAAIGAYERQVAEILVERGVAMDAEQRTAFQTQLAVFAYENDVKDLKLAYRLMRAEGNDPLPGVQARRGDVGYL